MIAREVKIWLLMMSSVLASNFARKESLWIKMRDGVATAYQLHMHIRILN